MTWSEILDWLIGLIMSLLKLLVVTVCSILIVLSTALLSYGKLYRLIDILSSAILKKLISTSILLKTCSFYFPYRSVTYWIYMAYIALSGLKAFKKAAIDESVAKSSNYACQHEKEAKIRTTDWRCQNQTSTEVKCFNSFLSGCALD